MPHPDADIARRLEFHPKGTSDHRGRDRGPVDHRAWLEFVREFGLTDEHAAEDWWAAWAELLLLADPGEYADRPLARRASTELPGTPSKVLVLQARAARGESLFHPGDAPLLQDRVALLPEVHRRSDRSPVAGTVEETHAGRRERRDRRAA